MKFTSLSKGVAVSAVALATALTAPAYAGGTIDVAIVGEPDTFDPMISTKDLVSIVTQHFVETLYSFDADWGVAPLLAVDLPTISDDGLVYEIALREGITFHDGSSMDAKDVVASLNRWLTVAPRGKAIAAKVDSIEASGDYGVTITLNEPYSPLVSLLAFTNSAAVVYPEEIIADTIETVVGTGPYQIAEHVPDQYLQLTRFDGYVSRTEPTSGASGERSQTPDEIRFVPVADASTRVEGLISGQFDFADGLPAESFARIEEADGVDPMLLKPFGWPLFAINHKDGLMTDHKIRQAVQAALPHDDMLFAAFGDDNFFLVDGPMYPEGYVWRNDASVDLYNRNDQARAAQLLQEVEYDGTPLRILTSRQYEFHFKMAEVAQVALEAAGFTVHMDVVDWATLGQRRNDPALWDVYITHSPFLPDPALTGLYYPTSRLGWADEEKDRLMGEFVQATDPVARQEIFAQIQARLLEDVGFIKIGGFSALNGVNSGLEGVIKSPWPFFWNASVN